MTSGIDIEAALESSSFAQKIAKKPQLGFLYGFCIWLVIFSISKFVGMFYTVDSGHLGIKTRFGALVTTPMEEGLHIINPFIDDVYQMDIKIQKVSVTCEASSQDLQGVKAQVDLQYHVRDSDAPRLYQQVGNRDDMTKIIIMPSMQEGVKSVTSTFTADKLITDRESVKANIMIAISAFIDDTLSAKNLVSSIQVANVAITDFTFSAIFNQAIEAKVNAEQVALQAENEKLTVITNANAQAEERKLVADATAYQINATATATAQAIIAEAQALVNNPELLLLRKIENWNGQLPKLESSTSADSFSGRINSLAAG